MPRQQLNIRIGDEERQAWTEAATKAKLDLSTWIRTACNVAANHPRELRQADSAVIAQFSEPQVGCPHPAKERTSYGICRLCKQKVQ